MGELLLFGIAATYVYLLATQEAQPWYLVAYVVLVVAGCLLAGGSIAYGRNPHVAQRGWYVGTLLSLVILGVDVATRLASLPGMTAMTGRWDFAPASFALAFGGAFVAVHGTVLVGINVAYPQRQQWAD